MEDETITQVIQESVKIEKNSRGYNWESRCGHKRKYHKDTLMKETNDTHCRMRLFNFTPCSCRKFTPAENNHSAETEVRILSKPERKEHVLSNSGVSSRLVQDTANSPKSIPEVRNEIEECIQSYRKTHYEFGWKYIIDYCPYTVLQATLSTMIECKKEELDFLKDIYQEANESRIMARIEQLQDEIGEEMNKNG